MLMDLAMVGALCICYLLIILFVDWSGRQIEER